MSNALVLAERALIADVEMLSAALSSSLSEVQALSLLALRASDHWMPHFELLSTLTEQRGLAAAVVSAKRSAKNDKFDVLMELLAIEARFGNSNLPAVLTGLAQRMRRSLAIKIQVIERINAVKHVAKIALAAPWLVLLVICSRAENLSAFLSFQGALVLLSGFSLCICSYLLMARIAIIPESPRMLSA